MVIFKSARKFRGGGSGTACDGFEHIAYGGEAGFDAGAVAGSTEPGTTPQTPGTRLGFIAIKPMMQVEVPITFTTSPSLTPAPTASQCASKAPTGMGMPGCRPSSFAHMPLRLPAIEFEVR